MSSLESRQLSKAVSPYINARTRPRFKAPWPRWYQPPIMPKGARKETRPTEIIAAACHRVGISVREFKSACRVQQYANARHAVVYILKRYRPDLSNHQIGRHIGRKDHTAIIHCELAAIKLRQTDPEFASLVAHLEGVANGC